MCKVRVSERKMRVSSNVAANFLLVHDNQLLTILFVFQDSSRSFFLLLLLLLLKLVFVAVVVVFIQP